VNLKTIILAAGKGTRMKSELPKVLHSVGGRPILEYVLDVARSVGSLKTYVVIGHQGQAVKTFLPKDIKTVVQRNLLGTADAVKCALPSIGPGQALTLILCGDTPLLTKETVKKIVTTHRKSNASVTVLTAKVEDPQGYGRIVRNSTGQMNAIREHKDATEDELKIPEINVGVYCFDNEKLFRTLKEIKLNPKKKEFYLTDIIELFDSKGYSIKTVTTDDHKEGLGVNTREDLAVAENILRLRVLKDLMLNGVTIVDPNTTYIDKNVKIGTDTIIRPFTFIEKDVTIGKRCSIGPFARLRSGTQLGNDVEIGNFTEINRSKISDKTLMKHFSYLGDAVVGRCVNIGAGSVTANFDGKNKNQTQIDDGAFIGSDAILVAPVKIGKGAVVGAGSVVTKGRNVPAGKVAVGIPARIIKRK
jgi:bifunctional UDP-N-acetylglucosamine pyrophosphorylase/glucosamine-1-phosphate N-acetyltransferase